MRAPSTKRLMEAFQIDRNTAQKIRAILKTEPNGRMLDKCNDLIGGFGVEAIQGDDWDSYYCDIAALYINKGDAYDATLLWGVGSHSVQLTTFGDYIERKERAML